MQQIALGCPLDRIDQPNRHARRMSRYEESARKTQIRNAKAVADERRSEERKKTKADRIALIHELAARGFSKADVAKRLGCTKQNIHNLAKVHGINFDGAMSR